MNSSLLLSESCPICDYPKRTLRFPSTLQATKAKVEDYVGTNTGYHKYHDIYECSHCNVLYMDPIDASLSDLCSDVVDNDYLTSWEERAHTFSDHLKILMKYITKGKLLDVGCYAGIFLNEAKKMGFHTTGVEPSKWAAHHAKSVVNCTVHEGMFNTVDVPNGPFDAVTFWDVIEHLADPKECLIKARNLLRPDGIIAITTHDIDSRFARLLGGNYPWLMRFHLIHFSPKTLTHLLEELGFEVLEVNFYRKSLSLNYFLKRLGINTPLNSFTKMRFSLNTGDMFMVVAKKK